MRAYAGYFMHLEGWACRPSSQVLASLEAQAPAPARGTSPEKAVVRPPVAAIKLGTWMSNAVRRDHCQLPFLPIAVKSPSHAFAFETLDGVVGRCFDGSTDFPETGWMSK
jgi:hypothetical protein